MTFERQITILSVGVAVIATVAASVQSYVAWRGRNDPLISAVLAEVARDCHDIAMEAQNSVVKTIPDDYMHHLLAEAASLDLLITAVDPSKQMAVQEEVQKFLDDEFDRAAANAGIGTTKPSNIKQEVEFRFIVNLNNKCADIIKSRL